MVNIFAKTHTLDFTRLLVQSFSKSLGGAQIQPQCSLKVLFTLNGKHRVVAVHSFIVYLLPWCKGTSRCDDILVCPIGELPILTESAWTQSSQFEGKKASGKSCKLCQTILLALRLRGGEEQMWRKDS